MTNQTNETVTALLKKNEWELADAMRQLKDCAENLVRRSQRAVDDCNAMIANEPCLLSWTGWIESDLRDAKDARAKVEELIRTKQILTYINKSEG